MNNQMDNFNTGHGHNDQQGPGGPGGPNKKGGPGKKKPSIWMVVISVLISIVMFAVFWQLFVGDSSNTQEVPYSQFITDLESGKIESADIMEDRISYTLVQEEEQNTSLLYQLYFGSGDVNRSSGRVQCSGI